MIVFDLICGEGAHQFEGWFGSTQEFDEQKLSGLLTCPVCGTANIMKALMAPNIGAKGNQKPDQSVPTLSASENHGGKSAETAESEVPNSAVQVPAEYKELLGQMAKAQKEILSQSEWVGNAFPEKAREMHYGDSEEKAIHGTATPKEAADLDEEGIELTPLPFPAAPPETQN